jgi:hypothetical protein
MQTVIYEIYEPCRCAYRNTGPGGIQEANRIIDFDVFRKKLCNSSILRLELSSYPEENVRMSPTETKKGILYLARSAALNPDAVTMMVWGVPFFFEADHNLVELPENVSRKPGRLSRFLGLSHVVVS